MPMQPSEKAFADLKALGAAAGATQGVFHHVTCADLDAIAQAPSPERPQATRKALTEAVVSSLAENAKYLKASTSSRAVQTARADAAVMSRGFIAHPTYGYVSESTVDAGAMMEAIRVRDPKFFAALASRIEDSAVNLAALEKLSKANFEMRGKAVFEGNVTADQLRSWVAGNAKPATGMPAGPTSAKTLSSKP